MTFGLGDRVRWATMGDDGLPLVRYGFVGGVAGERGPVMVMLDGELSGDVIDLDQLEPVSITNVELHLDGPDLIDDPELRRGLVHLWQAEAEQAGLDVDSHGVPRRRPAAARPELVARRPHERWRAVRRARPARPGRPRGRPDPRRALRF